MGTVVYLFPHVQVVKRTIVEIKRGSFDLVEHDIGPNDVRDVGQRPADFVAEDWHQIIERLQQHDDDNVDDPRTFEMHPVGIHVILDILVLFCFERLRLHL